MNIATAAINSLGLELLARAGARSQNALLSPYSIQTALAMAYAGADGDTRAEMARVLHYPPDEPAVHRSFTDLAKALGELSTEMPPPQLQDFMRHPITLTVANRLFGQAGYDFRPAFLALLRDSYAAPLELLDFAGQSAAATRHINDWVEAQTRRRIRDLIPAGTLDALTRLVLVNAIYLKAPWTSQFKESRTAARPFNLANGLRVDVPTMQQTHSYAYGYARHAGFTVLGLSYGSGDIHLLIILPDQVDGLAALEADLTAGFLAGCTNPPRQDVTIYLPRFRIEPPSVALSQQLQALGMSSAFDRPRGSANFDRMAPRNGEDYLAISEVFHKTFLNLDENGTEAAAATAVGVSTLGMPTEKPKPIEVQVDRPFFFAIQHRVSGGCLFMGRVMDPR